MTIAGRFAIANCLFFSATITSHVLAAEGRIVVRVVNEQGDPTAVRAWVDANGQRLFQPASPETATPYARDRSFSCDGEFTMVIPQGKAIVHIEKGKEFLPQEITVNVTAEETLEKTIQIRRWINMPENGWYSADMHVHLGFDNPPVLRQLALADDVHLMPAFTYWLRGQGETWQAQWPDGTFNDAIVIDESHLITRNNIEIERIRRDAEPGGSVGATFLFNLRRPITAIRYGEHYPTDAQLCRAARLHSPLVVLDSDKPSWSETVVGAVFGLLDTIQVCHNHYHRSTTIPGGYGMIGPLAAGESNAAVGDGLFHRTNALYYRFLNCGFRLGVSGGSAIGVMPLAAGHHRVYAMVDGDLTADKMWDAIGQGRTFATTGPMMTLTANGQPIGSTLTVASGTGASVAIQTRVRAIEQLESLEIIHDGQVVATQDLRSKPLDDFIESVLEFKVVPERSGWIASRVLYRAPDGLLRQAHTSPIYVSVDGKPTASATDARYMIRWIDRLTQIASSQPDRFPDESTANAVLTNYSEARERYQEIVNRAINEWSDD